MYNLLLCIILCATNLYSQLISLETVDETIKIECWYATYNNFTGKRIYPQAYFKKCYLLEHVAHALKKVHDELKEQGMGLLVWDAYRPMEGQKALWDCYPVEGFVAPPHKGGRHTRGTTVDLTIIDLKTGQPLFMGTGFDVFTPQAASDNTEITQEAQRNRALLKTVMEKHGFVQLPSEWWHFDYQNMHDYSPRTETFDDLDRLY